MLHCTPCKQPAVGIGLDEGLKRVRSEYQRRGQGASVVQVRKEAKRRLAGPVRHDRCQTPIVRRTFGERSANTQAESADALPVAVRVGCFEFKSIIILYLICSSLLTTSCVRRLHPHPFHYAYTPLPSEHKQTISMSTRCRDSVLLSRLCASQGLCSNHAFCTLLRTSGGDSTCSSLQL
jgi:hypothetical protein